MHSTLCCICVDVRYDDGANDQCERLSLITAGRPLSTNATRHAVVDMTTIEIFISVAGDCPFFDIYDLNKCIYLLRIFEIGTQTQTRHAYARLSGSK